MIILKLCNFVSYSYALTCIICLLNFFTWTCRVAVLAVRTLTPLIYLNYVLQVRIKAVSVT